jgi:hypothetical protein
MGLWFLMKVKQQFFTGPMGTGIFSSLFYLQFGGESMSKVSRTNDKLACNRIMAQEDHQNVLAVSHKRRPVSSFSSGRFGEGR